MPDYLYSIETFNNNSGKILKPLQKWKYNTDKEINTYFIYKTRLALKINASQIIKYYILTQLKIHINVFFPKS
jgi:hypothetical protein